MECIGCRLANQEQSAHVVWEDDHVCCFLDHNPHNEGQNFSNFHKEDSETLLEDEVQLEKTKRTMIDTLKVLD